MSWWKKLNNNPLARFGASILIFFYIIVIFADFFAPYRFDEYQVNGSLLPPTQIHWRNREGNFTAPFVYPTIQGATELETGDRKITVDYDKPSPIKFFVKGSSYNLFEITLPLPPKFEAVTIFPGIPAQRHLFGTMGEGKINLLGTDEQGRDELPGWHRSNNLQVFE